MSKKFRAFVMILVVVLVVGSAIPMAVAAPQSQDVTLQFWSTETQPARAEKTKACM